MKKRKLMGIGTSLALLDQPELRLALRECSFIGEARRGAIDNSGRPSGLCARFWERNSHDDPFGAIGQSRSDLNGRRKISCFMIRFMS